jgi:hypothetical protein
MTVVRREIEIGNDTCILGFSGREMVDSAVFDTSYLTPGGVDEVQTVTITGSPTGGTFTLSYKGQVTSALAYNASAAAVQTALRALSRIGSNGVTVTGGPGPGTPYVVTFGGALGKLDVDLLVGNGAGLTGGTTPAVSVAETTKGSSLDAGHTVLKSGLVLAKSADGKSVIPYTGAGNVNEVQTVTITGTPTGGTVTLVFEGERTAAIAYNANAAAVQTALEGLPNLDPGDVTVTGGPGPGTPWVVTFTGDRAGESVELLQAENALTGGTNPAVTVGQTTQGAENEQIVGIFDGQRETLDATGRSKLAIPVYNHNVVFDKDKVQGYTTHKGALERWARDHACEFRSQGNH